MPLFAIFAHDKPDHLQVRLDVRDEHLAYLKASDALQLAGPLLEDGRMCGSLVVIEADDLAAATKWADADPYSRAGLFQSREITEWKRVFG